MTFFSELFPCCPFSCFKSSNKQKYEAKADYEVNAVKDTTRAEDSGEVKAVNDEEFKALFYRLASDDGEIDAYQLRDILNNNVAAASKSGGFSSDLCRSMVATLDGDLSGQLGFEEARMLREAIIKWRKAFDSLDKDDSGYLHDSELDTLLNMLGVKVGPRTTKAIVARYSDKEGRISFVDFVACMVRLHTVMEAYETKDEDCRNGEAQFLLDEFIQMTVYS